MAVKYERVRPKPPPLPAAPVVARVCCMCGARAGFGVGHSHRAGTPGVWFCAEHFWASPHGVATALLMQADANVGADDVEEGERQ